MHALLNLNTSIGKEIIIIIDPVVISCGDPGTPTNGLRTVRRGFFYLGSVEFKCNNNYKLDGVSRIYCKRDGNWSRPTPRCLGQQKGTPPCSSIIYTCNRSAESVRPRSDSGTSLNIHVAFGWCPSTNLGTVPGHGH